MMVYDQKKFLVREISRYIRKYNVKTLLDIGAGFTITALPIKKLVKTYLAVEAHRERARILRNSGIVVLNKSFPTKILRQYDMVLISHAIPEKERLYKKFFTEVWKLVKPGGLLLIVTFKGAKGDLYRLRKKVFGQWKDNDTKKFQKMIEILKRTAEIKISQATSIAYASSAKDMTEFLLHWIVNPRKEGAGVFSQIQHIIESQYRSKRRYFFPFEHLFIEVKKEE